VSLRILEIGSEEDLEAAKSFFSDYARMLETICGMAPEIHGIDLEITRMPEGYEPPAGGIWLARDDGGDVLGCLALRPFGSGVAELKRLWVTPAARGRNVGRALVLAVMEGARKRGYARVVLDTAPQLQSSHALYRSLGYEEIAPYHGTPMEGMLYFGRDL